MIGFYRAYIPFNLFIFSLFWFFTSSDLHAHTEHLHWDYMRIYTLLVFDMYIILDLIIFGCAWGGIEHEPVYVK